MVCKVLSFYITGLFCIAGGERKHDHRAPDSLERLNSQLKDPQFISDTQWSDTCSIISRYEIDREAREKRAKTVNRRQKKFRKLHRCLPPESRLPIVDEIMAGHMSYKLILTTTTQKPEQDFRKSKTTNFLTVNFLRTHTK